MRRALHPVFAAIVAVLSAGAAAAQAPLQSRVWMLPLQQDGASGASGQTMQLSVTNLSARPAHLTFRHYGALGQPQPWSMTNNVASGGEAVGQTLDAGATKTFHTGGSGMTATFTLVLSDAPVVVVAYANRVKIGGRIDYVRTVSLAFDCDGADAQTFPCRQPLTAMLGPRPQPPGPTPTPPSPRDNVILGDGPRLAPLTPTPTPAPQYTRRPVRPAPRPQ